MAGIARGIFNFGTAPFRWAYTATTNTTAWAKEKISKASQAAKNIFQTTKTNVQKNAWYTPDPAMPKTRDALKLLGSWLSKNKRTISNDGKRAELLNRTNAALASLNSMLAEVVTSSNFYEPTNQQITDFQALQKYLLGIRDFLNANPQTPCQVPFVNLQRGAIAGKSDFLRLFASALKFADQWAKPRGPVTGLQNRVVKPITKRLLQRPSQEMRTCVRLTEAIAQLRPNLTQQQARKRARPMVEQLVLVIDLVILQRCGPHGVGSFEIQELIPLILLQASLEDLLDQPATPAFVQQVQNLLQVPATAHFLKQYGKKGYRPSITQRESDPIVLAAGQQLQLFNQTSTALVAQNQPLSVALQGQIVPLRKGIRTVLANYPQLEGEKRLILQDGERALAELINSQGVLSNVQQERLLAAQECLEGLFRVEQGWLARQADTVTSVYYMPTYTPPVQIVSAYASLNRLEQIAQNAHIPALQRPALLGASAQGAASDLRNLLTWLRESEQSDLYSNYFRRQLENLATHLERPANHTEQSVTDLLERVDTPFTRVQPRLDFWSRSGQFGHRTLPAIDSSSRRSVLLLKNITSTFHNALLEKTTFPAAITRRLVQAITNLEREMNWGLVEADPQLRAQLTQTYQNFQLAIQNPNWAAQQDSREAAAIQFQALETSITDLVHATTYTASNDRGLPWASFDVPFLPEFEELHKRLALLHTAIEEGNKDIILKYTRNTWAFLQAFLEQDNGNSTALVARYQLKPEMLQSLRELTAVLNRTVKLQARGSCDPTNLQNFHFRRQPAAIGTSNAIVVYSPYQAIQQTLSFLGHWKRLSNDHLQGGPRPVWALTKRVVIGRNSPPPALQAPAPLMRRAAELTWETLTIIEKRQAVTGAITFLNQEISANPSAAPALQLILAPLKRFARLPTHQVISQQDRLQVRNSIVELGLRPQAITHTQPSRPALPFTFADRGLLGAALGGVIPLAPRAAAYARTWIPSWAPQNVTDRLSDQAVNSYAESAALSIHNTVSDWMTRPARPTNPRGSGGPGGPGGPDGGGGGSGGGSGGPSGPGRPGGPGGPGRPGGPGGPDGGDGGSGGGSGGPSGPSGPGGPDGPGGPGGQGNMAGIGAFLGRALRFFNQIKAGDLSSAANTLGVNGLPTAAISFGANRIADVLGLYIQSLDKRRDKETITQLKSLQKAIRRAGQHQTLDHASFVIKKAMKSLGINPKSVKFDTDTPYFFDLQEKCEKALRFNKRSTPIEKPVKELVDEQKRLFVENNGYFAPMKVLYEWVCGKEAQDLSFYADIIREAKAAGPEQEASVLKELFMQKLEQANVDFIRRTFVRYVFFPILSHLTKKYLQIFADRGLEWIREFINKNDKDSATPLANRTIERTNAFLESVQGAYRRIASKTTPTPRTLQKELDKELSLPAVNDGLTQDELHQKTADKLIDTFIAPDFAQWTRGIRQSLGSIHVGTKDSVPDVIVNSTLVVLSWALTILLFPFEWITRNATLAIAKRSIINGQLVGTLINSSVQSIHMNGYTHALNCVLYDQLYEVLDILRQHYGMTKAKSQHGRKQKNDDPINLKNISIVEKEKLHTFVRQIFSILEKHKCGRIEDLRGLVNNKSELEKITDKFQDKVLYSKITDGIEEVLGATIHTILKKDQLEKQFYQLTTAINSTYKKNVQIPVEEFKAKEDGINKLLDTILSLVISKTIDEQIDSDKSHEQRSTNAYIKEIEKISKTLDKSLKPRLTKLYSKRHHGVLPINAEVQTLLDEMLRKSNAAVNQLIDLRARVKAAPELSQGKTYLLTTLKDLHTKLDGIVTPLTALHNPHAHKLLGKKMKQSVERFSSRLTEIQDFLQDPTPNNLKSAKEKLESLKTLLSERFNKEPALADASFMLEKQLSRLKNLLKKLDKSVSIEHELSHTLDASSESSPLYLWFSKLGTLAASSAPAKSAYAKVEASLQKLSSFPQERDQLRSLIDKLKNASSSTQRQAAFRKFKEIRKTLLHKATADTQQGKTTMSSIKRLCKIELAKARFTRDIPPQNATKQLMSGFKHFEQWLKQKRSIALKNTGWLRHLPGRDSLVGMGKNFIYNRVKEKVDGLLGLIRDPVFWHHGLFNANVLRPFVRGA